VVRLAASGGGRKGFFSPMDGATKRIVVIGGGISGLSAAFRLQELGRRVAPPPEIVLLEASSRLGGVIRTEHRDGVLLEYGPDSFVSVKPAALELVRKVGLEDEIVSTRRHGRRAYVFWGGRPVPLPAGFALFAPTRIAPLLASPLFTLGGKLRMMVEPLIPPSPPPEGDESVASFVRRRLGSEALERVVQPMVGAIWGGDAERLSARAVIPQIVALEGRGGVVRGLMRASRERESAGPRYGTILALRRGMGSLVDALRERLDMVRVRLSAKVESVSRREGLWEVRCAAGECLAADGLIVAVPAYVASPLLAGVDGGLGRLLASIPYGSTAVVNFVFDKDRLRRPIDGFGVVVPPAAGLGTLACSLSSLKFPCRVRDERLLLVRTFLGGVLHEGVMNLGDAELVGMAEKETRLILGLEGSPRLAVLARHPRAMAQYEVGHLDRVAEVEGLVAGLRGLAVAGGALRGVGMPDCIASGTAAAEKVASDLGLHRP